MVWKTLQPAQPYFGTPKYGWADLYFFAICMLKP